MSEARELRRSSSLQRKGSAELRRDVLATLMPGFAGLAMPAWVADSFAEGLLSVCVYGENVRDAAQLRALGAELRAACPGALIAIDEEGGEVTRLHYLEGSPYPGAAVMGRIDDVEYTELIGERVGRDILSAGFNLALGPIADVNSNPLNPVIGTRSFAADPELASRHVAAWTRGLQRTGALACAKHFPGHGDTAQDSHLALPTVDVPLQVLERRELPPFLSAVNAGVASIMTSHILLPQVDPSGPATFSRLVLQGMLRDEMEFDGIIISDALDMKGACGEIGIPAAAVRALVAGCDLLCLGTNTGTDLLEEIVAAVLAAVEDGTLSETRLAEAAGRVRAAAAVMPHISSRSKNGAALTKSGASHVEPVEPSRRAKRRVRQNSVASSTHSKVCTRRATGSPHTRTHRCFAWSQRQTWPSATHHGGRSRPRLILFSIRSSKLRRSPHVCSASSATRGPPTSAPGLLPSGVTCIACQRPGRQSTRSGRQARLYSALKWAGPARVRLGHMPISAATAHRASWAPHCCTSLKENLNDRRRPGAARRSARDR